MAAVELLSVGATNGKPLFSGNSEIDQLHVNKKVLGLLPQAELLIENPKSNGIKLAEARSHPNAPSLTGD